MFFRLCLTAPENFACFLGAGLRLFWGTGIELLPERYFPVSEALPFFDSGGERPLKYHRPTALAGAGPQVDDVIGRAHDLRVMLDDQDRVAQISASRFRIFTSRSVFPAVQGRLTARPARNKPPPVATTSDVANWMRCASPPESGRR